jgi:formate hydrogenlyase subunit 6/NADH:ubiquinone oxidoreductase subunit I
MGVRKREKDLNFWEKIYIPEIVKGLSLTLKSMFKPKFTMKYPEEKFIPPASYRGRPVLVMEQNGEERCVACGLCSCLSGHSNRAKLLKLKEKKKDILKSLRSICFDASSVDFVKKYARKKQS